MCVDSANCDGNCSECQYDSIKRLRAQVAALEKDNDDIHELAEHYRVENARLREALGTVIKWADKGRHDEDFVAIAMLAERVLDGKPQ